MATLRAQLQQLEKAHATTTGNPFIDGTHKYTTHITVGAETTTTNKVTNLTTGEVIPSNQRWDELYEQARKAYFKRYGKHDGEIRVVIGGETFDNPGD